MKRNIRSTAQKSILTLAIVGLITTACKDNFLDRQPLDQLSTATFWKTESDAALALNGVYFVEGFEITNANGAKQTYSFWNQDTHMRVFEATTDNGFEKDDNVTDFNNGDMNPSIIVVANLWKSAYVKIAKCNNFLANIDKVEMDEAKKEIMKAEARMIRAHDYFYLSFYWGDVPLITDVLTIDQANNVTRTPKTEVVDFVMNELKAAADVLPTTRPPNERGRMTKGAALAILGRAQMAEKMWSDARITYKAIMDLGVYSIDTRWKQLFEDEGEESNEVVMTSVRMNDVYGNSVLLSSHGFTWGGYHHWSPYNELVEDFECADGLPINESPLYNVDEPYQNRDPRLLMTILVNGISKFRNILYISHPDSSATKYPDQVTRRPWSGYILNKFSDEGFTGNIRAYGGDFVMVRYAEVLLSYLEASIEDKQAITPALLDETINAVRTRPSVNMPKVTETDADKLTTILRRERRVELAWEGLRLYDLFRWKIAHEKLRGSFYGMKITSAAEAPTYSKFKVDENGYYFCEETFFRQDVDYLWPIPQSERDVNPKLKQNPGYSGAD